MKTRWHQWPWYDSISTKIALEVILISTIHSYSKSKYSELKPSTVTHEHAHKNVGTQEEVCTYRNTMRVELNLTKLNTEKHSRYSNSIIDWSCSQGGGPQIARWPWRCSLLNLSIGSIGRLFKDLDVTKHHYFTNTVTKFTTSNVSSLIVNLIWMDDSCALSGDE